MIEFALLAFVMNKVVKLCDERGRSWKPLAALLVVLWFGLEIPVVVGLLVSGASTPAALAGGVVAAVHGEHHTEEKKSESGKQESGLAPLPGPTVHVIRVGN